MPFHICSPGRAPIPASLSRSAQRTEQEARRGKWQRWKVPCLLLKAVAAMLLDDRRCSALRPELNGGAPSLPSDQLFS